MNPIKQIRKAKGLTQAGLAVQAGVSPTTVALAECYAYLSRETASKLARALNIDVEAILPREREKGGVETVRMK